MNINQEDTTITLDAAQAARLEAAVFEGEGKQLRVDVHVIGDEQMASAHQEFLGVEGTTDVITFDLSGGGPGSDCAEDLDGEILVNAQLAAREAQDRGHSPEAELLFYVAHGLLHLLGYDDGSDEEREAMLSLQASYLSLAGTSLES